MKQNIISGKSGLAERISMGGFLLLITLYQIWAAWESSEPIVPLQLLAIGFFAILTIQAAFQVSGRMIDRDAGEIVSLRGLTFWKSQVTLAKFSDVTEVRIEAETKTSTNKNDWRTTYVIPVVYIVTEESRVRWKKLKEDSEAEARQVAEEVAKCIGVPMNDTTTGLRREVEELDLPLAERLEASGGVPELAPQPPSSAITVHQEPDRICFELQPTFNLMPLGLKLLAGFLVWQLVPWRVVLNSFGQTGLFTIVGVVATVILLVLLKEIKSQIKDRILVTVTPSRLEFERTGSSDSRQVMDLAELEELELIKNGKAWEARSDNAAIRFEESISRSDMSWMKDSLQHFICKLSRKANA